MHTERQPFTVPTSIIYMVFDDFFYLIWLFFPLFCKIDGWPIRQMTTHCFVTICVVKCVVCHAYINLFQTHQRQSSLFASFHNWQYLKTCMAIAQLETIY